MYFSMPKNKSFINLLPQEEFDASTLGRVLKWAMGTFRIIVIITEMIVMAAFLSRFWLDAQNSDLAESIKTKTAQIESQSDFEKQFRIIQTKLAIFKAINQEVKPSAKIGEIASNLPADLLLSAISLQTDGALIRGSASSEVGIAQFAGNLGGKESIKKVEILSLSTSEDKPGLTNFSIKISY